MPISSGQPSALAEARIKEKAMYIRNHNGSTSNGGDPLVSGSVQGGNLVLLKQSGTSVVVNNIATGDNFDHWIAGTLDVNITSSEVDEDWNNA